MGASAGCCCSRLRGCGGCGGCGAERAGVEADAASVRALFLGGRADAGCDADEDRVMGLLCDPSGIITASNSNLVDGGAASLSACAPSGVRPSHRLKSRRSIEPPRRRSTSAGTADSSSTDERRLSSVSLARVCRCSAEIMPAPPSAGVRAPVRAHSGGAEGESMRTVTFARFSSSPSLPLLSF